MTRATIVKLVLLLAGLVVFAYGAHAGRSEIRWAGIGIVAVAFFMRLFPRERPPDRE